MKYNFDIEESGSEEEDGEYDDYEEDDEKHKVIELSE